MKLRNAWDRPLGLPKMTVTLDPGGISEDLSGTKVLQHPVVINWLRSGKMQLIGGDIEQLPIDDNPGGNLYAEAEHLQVLDQSIPKIAEAVKGLSDEHFSDVIAAEKNGKSRVGLLGEEGVFAEEWERRYGLGS